MDPSTLKPNFTLTLEDINGLPREDFLKIYWTFPKYYVFRNPFISSIRPILTPNETLSLLQEINSSQPSHTHLPMEMLLHINKLVHQNADYSEDIRSKWSPVLPKYDSEDDFESNHNELSSLHFPIRLDRAAKKYYASSAAPIQRGTMFEDLYSQISSADLLYRLRCYFPELVIDATVGDYKTVWSAILKHNETGIYLRCTEDKASSKMRMYYADEGVCSGDNCRRLAWKDEKNVLDPFINDLIGLLNAFCNTLDGSRRLAYYHPAAVGDFPTDDEHYIAVPDKTNAFECARDPYDDVYEKWHFENVSVLDVSLFPSVLQDLKYNIKSRKIDRARGTANLTTVISSALLFYRLLCKFLKQHRNDDIGQKLPKNSVWKIQLVHYKTGKHIIFMDNCGSFDICVELDASDSGEMKDDIDVLVEALCSDTCTHPYDGVVAGCIA